MNIPLTIAMTCLPLGQIDAEATFQRWDSNGDGWLSPAELPDRLQPNFTRVDTNQDGRISRQEHVRFLSPRKRLQPTDDHSRLRVLRNLAYVPNGHERHRLDVYLPPADGRRKPLVVWIHGGGCKAGSKNGCPAISLTERGFVVASVNYRLSQHAPFPAQIHDCKAAIRFLRANANKYGYNAERVGIAGSSASLTAKTISTSKPRAASCTESRQLSSVGSSPQQGRTMTTRRPAGRGSAVCSRRASNARRRVAPRESQSASAAQPTAAPAARAERSFRKAIGLLAAFVLLRRRETRG